MPANTAKGYPYPLGTDRVQDGDDAIKALAEAVDTKTGVTASGMATVPVTNGNVTVTFPVGRFTVPPAVTCTPQTSNANAATASVASAPTTTSVVLNGFRTSPGTALAIYWIANQNA